jgi:hypothetical protein
VVDGAPVFLSEVRLLARVRGEAAAPALEALIDERLMFREASRLPQAALAEAEAESAFLSLRPKLPEVTPGEEADLRRLARREATIVKYVEFRFRPQVRVTEEAVRGAWEAERASRTHALPFEEAAAGIRRRLSDRDLDARVEAWVKELRQAAQIRYNAPTS